MTSPLPQLGRHVTTSTTQLARRPVQVAIATAAIVTLLSVVLAPEASPSSWDWARIIVIGLLGIGSVLSFAAAQAADPDTDDRRQLLLMSAALMAVTIVLNLTFSIGATIIFSIGITTVTLLATGQPGRSTPWMVTGALVAAIPFWVWSALHAWTWMLLALVPLAAIGIVSDGHIRTAVAQPPEANAMLTPRGHRLAAWVGVLGSALTALALGMVTEASDGVVALGAVGAMALIALEAGTSQDAPGGPRRSIVVVDAALLWVALCWIVSL